MTTPTSPDPGRETRLIDIKGRLITVRQLKDAISRMFDILESAIVQQEDKDYLTALNVAGDLEITDLMVFISSFNEPQAAEKPKVRRGRPPLKRTAA